MHRFLPLFSLCVPYLFLTFSAPFSVPVLIPVSVQVSIESSRTMPTNDPSECDMSISAAPPLDDAESPPSSQADDPTTPPSKLAVFFGLTRRNLKSQLKRTKSMTRLYRDRKKVHGAGGDDRGENGAGGANDSFECHAQFGRLRTSRYRRKYILVCFTM